jgi:hypothetical protein
MSAKQKPEYFREYKRMRRAGRIKGAKASCLHCHEPYTVYWFHLGYNWCKCQGAQEERRRIKRGYDLEYGIQYYKAKREAIGKTVKGRGHIEDPPRHRGKVRDYETEEETKRQYYGVKVKVPLHQCTTPGCKTWSVNRWRCPSCHSRLSTGYNMDFLIEDDSGGRVNHRGGLYL